MKKFVEKWIRRLCDTDFKSRKDLVNEEQQCKEGVCASLRDKSWILLLIKKGYVSYTGLS